MPLFCTGMVKMTHFQGTIELSIVKGCSLRLIFLTRQNESNVGQDKISPDKCFVILYSLVCSALLYFNKLIMYLIRKQETSIKGLII